MSVAVAVLIGVAAATVVYIILHVLLHAHTLDDRDDDEYPAGYWGDP